MQIEIGGLWLTDMQPGTLVHPIGTILPMLHLTQTVAEEQFKQPCMRVKQREQVEFMAVSIRVK